jgi:hypothetical protein
MTWTASARFCSRSNDRRRGVRASVRCSGLTLVALALPIWHAATARAQQPLDLAPPPSSAGDPALDPSAGAPAAAAPAPQMQPIASERQLDSFAEVRTALLDAIAGATKRVWMATDYLTDGEIVSALYVAQYRKLDVQVLLGRARANHYMSRLSYLKNQNIPVYLKPDQTKFAQPTALLADDTLLTVDGDLNFLAKVRRYRVTAPKAGDRDQFVHAFAAAAGAKVPAMPMPMPLVGRPNPRGTVFHPIGGTAQSPAPSEAGVYYYDRKREARPANVPAKLPKNVKYNRGAPRPERRPEPVELPAEAPSALEQAPPTLPADSGKPEGG